MLEYSYLSCNNCERKFEADIVPAQCPFCGAPKQCFSYILVKDGDRIVTLQEERIRMLKILKSHLPAGMTADEVDRMSDRDIENLYDIITE